MVSAASLIRARQKMWLLVACSMPYHNSPYLQEGKETKTERSRVYQAHSAFYKKKKQHEQGDAHCAQGQT